MDVILGASIIAAFLAGMVALFAPCCITVLLPSYLASAFREKKHMLKMTFVFFAGISVILVPIGLGAAGLAQMFRDLHREMYIVGGGFMILLAFWTFSGKGLTMIPMPKRVKPNLDLTSVSSVFVLGIFSGAATSCCAPVLAGAVTLAVISGTFWKALIVTFAYVFGMVFPLFLAAYFYDRFKLEKSKLIQGKIWSFKLWGKDMALHSTNLVAGLVFLVMGIVLVVLALSDNAYWAPTYQAGIGNALKTFSESLADILVFVPDVIWGVLLIVLFLGLVYTAMRNNRS